jgi:plastocyanin
MPEKSARFAPLVILLVLLALGIASCGGDDSTTGETAATGAETESETETQEEAGGEGEPESEGSTPAPSGEARKSEKVEIVNFAYDPDPVTIAEGGKVTWVNEDSAPHTATADDGSFDTGTLEEGKLKSETFKEPGEYTYFCEIHPDMHGTVQVVPAE